MLKINSPSTQYKLKKKVVKMSSFDVKCENLNKQVICMTDDIITLTFNSSATAKVIPKIEADSNINGAALNLEYAIFNWENAEKYNSIPYKIDFQQQLLTA